MADKAPHSRAVTPLADADVATKLYADGSGGGGTGLNTTSADFVMASSQYANIADITEFDVGAMTAECWLHADSLPANGTVLGKIATAEGTYSFWIRTISTTGIQVTFSTNGNSAGQNITQSHGIDLLNSWHHIAATWDGSNGDTIIYVDGVALAAPVTLGVGTLHDGATSFAVGRLGDHPEYTDGAISEVRIWDVVRTPAEINDNMFRVASGNESGLLAVYHLDNNFDDAGPNELHLTAVNGPTFTTNIPWGPSTSALLTSDGPVNVSTTSAPTTGQVLTAIDGSTADWQTNPATTNGIALNSESMDFEVGSSQYASVADPGVFHGHTSFSFEFWINPESIVASPLQSIIGQGISPTNYAFYALTSSATNIQFSVSTNGNFVGSFVDIAHNHTVGTWAHWAVTWEGATGNMNVYKDGALVSGPTPLHTGSVYNSTGLFYIGAIDNLVRYWDGKISEVRTWSTERTATEIAENMYRVMHGNEKGLITLHHLDGNFIDAGPNSVDLTATNGPISASSDVPYGAVAQSLLVDGGAVNVSASPAPTVGQVLTAVDGVSATWQDSAGGGEVVAAAQGAYMVKTMGTSQASVTTGTLLNFDTVVSSRGDLGGAGNQVTGLKAGRTYLLIGRSWNTSGSYVSLKFYDATAAAYLGHINTGTAGNVFESPNVTHIFTPTVETAIELWCSSANSSSTFNGDHSELEVIEIGAVQANVIGGLEFMDIIDVTVATDTVSFGSAGDGLHKRDLDGDVDEEYFCSYYMPGDHAGSTMTWVVRPNGVSTAQQIALDYSGASSGKITATSFVLGDQFVARDCRGTFTLFAKTGRARYFVSDNVVTAPAGGSGEMHQSRNAGTWDDQAANITSLVFAHTDGALDYILPGAQFVLWRRTRSNTRADSAAVYERHAMEAVNPSDLFTTERTVGHTIYSGSVVGVSVRVEDAVTAGDITVNVKVGGVTTVTAVLDTTNSTSRVVRASIGTHKFAVDENVSVEFVPTGYDNAGSVVSPVTVQVHLTNDALLQPPKAIGYAELSLSTTQTTNLAVNNHVEWDQIASRGDLFSLATGAGQANGLLTIQPGTYDIECLLRMSSSAASGSNEAAWQLRNDSGDAVITTDSGRSFTILTTAIDLPNGWSVLPVQKGIFTFTVATTVKIELFSISGAILTLRDQSYLVIKELR